MFSRLAGQVGWLPIGKNREREVFLNINIVLFPLWRYKTNMIKAYRWLDRVQKQFPNLFYQWRYGFA